MHPLPNSAEKKFISEIEITPQCTGLFTGTAIYQGLPTKLIMYLGKKTQLYIGLILIPFITLSISYSCEKEEKDEPINTGYEIVKIHPSKHNYNDGSLEVKFSDNRFTPEVRWKKDIYNGYSEVSSAYVAESLSSGMYLLEILPPLKPSIFDTLFLATYDTVSPGDYFPIYPGSFWIYDNSDSIKSHEEYALIGLGHKYTGISQTHGPYNIPGFPVDSIYVPSIHVSSIHGDYNFYNYSITMGSFLMRFLPVVNEEEGYYLQQWQDGRYYDDYNSLRILKVDTSLYIGNTLYEDVIVAEHFNMPNLVGGWESNYDYVTKILYFSKNIGLIKSQAFLSYRIDQVLFRDTITINLTDYFIADK
jgi:hypothetical protein